MKKNGGASVSSTVKNLDWWELTPPLITQVIFGSKMEPWQIARIMLFATGYEMVANTQFLFSTPSRKSWTFENKPKKMSLCDKCSGYGYLVEEPTSE